MTFGTTYVVTKTGNVGVTKQSDVFVQQLLCKNNKYYII
jgi:hypothetical protein